MQKCALIITKLFFFKKVFSSFFIGILFNDISVILIVFRTKFRRIVNGPDILL